MIAYPAGTRMVFRKTPGDGHNLDSYDKFNGKIVTLTQELAHGHLDTIGYGMLDDGNPLIFYARWVRPCSSLGFGNWIRTKGK